MIQAPTTPIIDLGEHSLEIDEDGILIASHAGSHAIPVREVITLDNYEAYRLYSALHTLFAQEGRTITDC